MTTLQKQLAVGKKKVCGLVEVPSFCMTPLLCSLSSKFLHRISIALCQYRPHYFLLDVEGCQMGMLHSWWGGWFYYTKPTIVPQLKSENNILYVNQQSDQKCANHHFGTGSF